MAAMQKRPGPRLARDLGPRLRDAFTVAPSLPRDIELQLERLKLAELLRRVMEAGDGAESASVRVPPRR